QCCYFVCNVYHKLFFTCLYNRCQNTKIKKVLPLSSGKFDPIKIRGKFSLKTLFSAKHLRNLCGEFKKISNRHTNIVRFAYILAYAKDQIQMVTVVPPGNWRTYPGFFIVLLEYLLWPVGTYSGQERTRRDRTGRSVGSIRTGGGTHRKILHVRQAVHRL